jgi:ATP/maltotriose-dependent transcriptional regulator MalT
VEQAEAGLLRSGLEAVRGGRWAEGVVALEGALDELSADRQATALDALADARWWLGEELAATAARERVYRLHRDAGDRRQAARTAAWLAREHAAGGNLPVARGWLARAETLVSAETDQAALGWVALARATLAETPDDQASAAGEAVECARATDDGDLELLALSRLGLALVMRGDVRPGLERLDEAMAAASAGDATDVTTEAQLCCDLVLASELSGDRDWFSRWIATVSRVATTRGQPSPMSFCTTCCAESSAAHGDYAGAQQQLHLAVIELNRSGLQSRCIAPGTKLAELYLNQGRLEDAEEAVGDADDDLSLLVRARIALAHGQPGLAATLAQRAVSRFGPDNLLNTAPLALLVEAQLMAGDHAAAAETSARLDALANTLEDRPARARAALARGRLRLSAAQTEQACAAFEQVLVETRGATCLEAATAELELARLRIDGRPDVARADARAALRDFEALGAARQADAARAVLRALGSHSRVGPKDVGVLSQREQEVLRLVAQGLTNAEIAARLFISTKTAGHHVSAILAKLGVRSRTEAAAQALLRSSDSARAPASGPPAGDQQKWGER